MGRKINIGQVDRTGNKEDITAANTATKLQRGKKKEKNKTFRLEKQDMFGKNSCQVPCIRKPDNSSDVQTNVEINHNTPAITLECYPYYSPPLP